MKYFIIIFSLILTTIILAMTPNSKTDTNQEKVLNVLGTELQACCFEPRTGWFRDGYCNTAQNDYGTHVVCAIMTDEFLDYTSTCGNDLITPRPEYNFPGLKEGDKWCLCVSRWKEAMEKGKAPSVVLESTHSKALEIVTIEELKRFQK